jgi:ubiquitin-like-conjugating enzyme ATG3
LSITYDFYYKTPRLWLIGYSENGQVLSETEIFEDIMADYAKKTVTIESHPHSAQKEASIHPCNHAKVMKKIIDKIEEFVLRNEVSRDKITCKFKTVSPRERISYEQWCKEFRVSMMYDRRIVHMS